jgi:hypothetical protein
MNEEACWPSGLRGPHWRLAKETETDVSELNPNGWPTMNLGPEFQQVGVVDDAIRAIGMKYNENAGLKERVEVTGMMSDEVLPSTLKELKTRESSPARRQAFEDSWRDALQGVCCGDRRSSSRMGPRSLVVVDGG